MLRNCPEVRRGEAGDGRGDRTVWEANAGPGQPVTLKASGSNPGFSEEPASMQVQAKTPH